MTGDLLSDPADLAILRSRPCPTMDCLNSCFCFSLSLSASGTPSHFELTLGTVGGKLAEETPGIPTVVVRPGPCFSKRFSYSAKAWAEGSLAPKRPMKKLGRFLGVFLSGFEAIAEEVVEEDWREEVLMSSTGGSLGEEQKLDCTGEVRLVEAVILEASVEIVLIESVSENLLRYESLGRRRVGWI